jgi:hypothetical protein
MTVRSIGQEATKRVSACTSTPTSGFLRRNAGPFTYLGSAIRPRDAPLTARQSAGRVAGTVVARP